LLTGGFPASKGTAQVIALGVAGMGQKENPAMLTLGPASPQLRLGPEHGAKDEVVRQDQSSHFALAVPIWGKFEVFLDFYCKKPRFSLIVLMYLVMSSF